MNFLAHLALSGRNAEVIMGNFTGDYVKGRLLAGKFPDRTPGYMAGVKLHRYIDHYTDTHPLVRQMIRKVAERYARSAAVATDVFFDHFLAINFEKYYSTSLETFKALMYAVIRAHPHFIPDKMRPLADALIRHDWLGHYGEISGLQTTFENMARRYPFLSNLSTVTDELQANFEEYERYFSEFYPGLQQACRRFLADMQLRGL